jgi:hypothetical protein
VLKLNDRPEKRARNWDVGFPCRDFSWLMTEDIRISYLLYIIAAIVVMGFLLVGGLFLWFR